MFDIETIVVRGAILLVTALVLAVVAFRGEAHRLIQGGWIPQVAFPGIAIQGSSIHPQCLQETLLPSRIIGVWI